MSDILLKLRLGGQRVVSAGLKDTANDVEGIGRASERAGAASNRAFRGISSGVGGITRRLVGLAAATGGIYAVRRGMDVSLDAASDLNEEVNKTSVVFRGHERGLLRWSRTAADALGQSRQQALEATNVFGNMLVPLRFGRDEAAGMSRRMVTLASDLASFNNADPSDVLEAMRAGLAGESEPLRRYGVFLNDARLKHAALAAGVYKGTGVLSNHAKAVATYALLLKDTSDAQGDFARTSSGLANQKRILEAERADLAASAGKLLIPAASEVTPYATRLVKRLKKALDDEDLTFGEKARFVWRATKKDLDPAIDDIEAWLEREDVKQRIVDGIETWTPRIIDATAESMATAAPRAAGAFIKGFTTLGPWGQLLTVGFLMKKFGAFGPAGRLTAGLFSRAWASSALKSAVWGDTGRTIGTRVGTKVAAETAAGTAAQLPLSMEARRGRFARIGSRFGRGLGRAAGAAAAAGLALELSEGLADAFGAGPDERRKRRELGMNPMGSTVGGNPGGPMPWDQWADDVGQKALDLIGFAGGGVVGPSDGPVQLVGEEGPELVRMPTGTRVTPAPETREVIRRAQQGPLVLARRDLHVHLQVGRETLTRETLRGIDDDEAYR